VASGEPYLTCGQARLKLAIHKSCFRSLCLQAGQVLFGLLDALRITRSGLRTSVYDRCD